MDESGILENVQADQRCFVIWSVFVAEKLTYVHFIPKLDPGTAG